MWPLQLNVRPNNMPPGALGGGPPPIAAMQRPSYVLKPDDAAPLAPDAGLTGGGGFLRSAAMTAAGIVGGALVFEGIQSMFGQHDAATITGELSATGPRQVPRPPDPPQTTNTGSAGFRVAASPMIR